MTFNAGKTAFVICALLLCLFMQAESVRGQNSDTAIKAAMAAIEQKEYKQAIDSLTGVIGAEPKNDEAYAQRSRAYLLLGDPANIANALADAKKAFDLNSKNTVALNIRGLVELKQKDQEAALATFNRAIKIDPAFVKPYLNRAGIWTDRKEFDKAIADYTATLRLEPKNQIALRSRATLYIDHKKDYAGAVADLNEYLKGIPQSAGALALRGLAYEQLKDNDRALADYTATLALEPKNEFTYFHRGYVYYAKSDFDHALADYAKLLELNPAFYEANYNRGLIYKMQKRFEMAAVELRKVPADAPQYKTAQEQLDEIQPASTAGGIRLTSEPFKLFFDPHAESYSVREHINADQPFQVPNTPYTFVGKYDFTQPAGKIFSIQLAMHLANKETGGHLLKDLDATFFTLDKIQNADFEYYNIKYRVSQPLNHRYSLQVAYTRPTEGTELDLHALDPKYLRYNNNWDLVNKALFFFGNAIAYNAFVPDVTDETGTPLTKNPDCVSFDEKGHLLIWRVGKFATWDEAYKVQTAIMKSFRRYLDADKFEFQGGGNQFTGIGSKVIKVGVPSVTFHIAEKDGAFELTTWS
jgi:tetratricopeptide (TPR) repeat protein